jgi:hypothetical protein
MVNLAVIQDRVNTAKLFYQTLLIKYKALLVTGCDDLPDKLLCTKWLILALNSDLLNAYNTTKTQTLYNKLNQILGSYNVSFVPNSQVQIPNTTYVTTGGSVLPTISITSANFVGATYTNAALIGFTFAVFDQNANRFLNYGVEYTYNAAGGIIIVAGIFGGESYKLIDIIQS